jgi:hypothetical protein
VTRPGWPRIDGLRVLELGTPGDMRRWLNDLVLSGTKKATAGRLADYEAEGEELEQPGSGSSSSTTTCGRSGSSRSTASTSPRSATCPGSSPRRRTRAMRPSRSGGRGIVATGTRRTESMSPTMSPSCWCGCTSFPRRDRTDGSSGGGCRRRAGPRSGAEVELQPPGWKHRNGIAAAARHAAEGSGAQHGDQHVPLGLARRIRFTCPRSSRSLGAVADLAPPEGVRSVEEFTRSPRPQVADAAAVRGLLPLG